MGTICKGTAKVRLFFESASGSAKKSLKNIGKHPLNLDSCVRNAVVVAEIAVEILEISRYGHHGGIVGSEAPFGYECLDAFLPAEVGHGIAHAAVCRHSASYSHCCDACGVDSLGQLAKQNIDDGRLQRCGKVGLASLHKVGVGAQIIAQSVQERCL